MRKLKFSINFFKSLPMIQAGLNRRPPCWLGPPPTPESSPAIGRTAGSMAGPGWQRRYCKKWGLKINNNRILNLVSSPFYRSPNFGDSYFGHFLSHRPANGL